MFKRDAGDEAMGALIGIGIVIAIIIFIVYVMVLIAGIIAAVAGGIGVLYGGGTAIVNYASSFKENIIDSNKKNAMIAA